jgi:23S rRNA pseudouridine1911/1915/1917 synthase
MHKKEYWKEKIGHGIMEKNFYMKAIVENKTTLLEVLQRMSPDSSKNTLRSWLEAGRVLVDKKPSLRANTEVLPGQEVSVGPKVSFLRGSIRILHEDEDLVVLEKPEGLLSVATDFGKEPSVHAMLKKRFHNRRVYPVHRLDRETSGVMIFAYTEKARDFLKKEFEERRVGKTYFAIVEGKRLEPKGTWECYLEEDDFYYVKSTGDSQNGKLAVTHFDVVKCKGNFTLLRLKPQTGRKNQLRVHCAEAGFPIAGDKKYRAKTNPLKRLCLHAHQISFIHPKGRRMTFQALWPENFNKLFDIKDLSL